MTGAAVCWPPRMRLSCNSVRSALLLLVVAFVLSVAPAGATDQIAEENPHLGAGYMYWKSEVRSKAGKKSLTTSVIQRRLADGYERVLFSARNSRIRALFAEGDNVAFAIETTRRKTTHKRRGLATDRIYAMSAADARPSLIVEAKFSKRFVDEDPSWNCGTSVELFSVDAAGQLLTDGGDIDCKTRRERDFTRIYNLNGAPPLNLKGFLDSPVDAVKFGTLITSDYDESISLTDLKTGAKRVLPDHFLAEQVELSETGWIATVSAKDESFDQFVRVFQPGATTPTLDFRNDLGESTVAFCADGFVEMTMPWEYKKQPMRITYRGLDGQVRSRTTGPNAGFGYDAVCEGRHLTIAVRRWRNSPAVFNYDL